MEAAVLGKAPLKHETAPANFAVGKYLYNFYWPAHPGDPQGIRVASVIEFSVCLFILSKFSNFYTVQYSRVQYSTV